MIKVNSLSELAAGDVVEIEAQGFNVGGPRVVTVNVQGIMWAEALYELNTPDKKLTGNSYRVVENDTLFGNNPTDIHENNITKIEDNRYEGWKYVDGGILLS